MGSHSPAKLNETSRELADAGLNRAQLAALSWEELEERGLCDCGAPLDGHPPLPKPKPLSSWKASKTFDPVAAETARRAKTRNTEWNRAFRQKGS